MRETSANMGYDYASMTLAQEAEREKDYESAIKWYTLAMKQGAQGVSERTIERIKRKINRSI